MAENVKNLKKIQQIVAHKGGGTILSYDFSTLEVRIFSAISCDTTLRDVLLSGADLHCNTARNIFPELKGMSDKEIKEHHSGLRSKAKSTMFGLLYGKSAYNFSKEWGCTVEEAQETIDKMMGAYPGIKTYVEYQHKFAREHGYIVDVFGCTRPLPDAMLPDTKSNRKLLNHAMNASQNSGIQCFVGDTKIPLLDGSVVEIQNLVNNFENKYVLSCCNDGKIIPGKIINAFKSGETDTICKVTLDSGEIITCTPEHQFMLRDGTYKHAIDLKNNESLMPCYTKYDKLGYKYVKRNDLTTKPWASVHRIVSKYYDRTIEKNEAVHHKDFNKLNNNPDNLLIMDKAEHIKYHSSLVMSTIKRHADMTGVSVHEYLRQMGLKYTSKQRSIDTQKRVQEIREGKRENNIWKHFLTQEHSEKQSKLMAEKNKRRKELYKDWDFNQREAVKALVKKRIETYGNAFCMSKEQLSESARKTINKIWKGNDLEKIQHMKNNIRNCGKNTTFYKFKKLSLKIIEKLGKNILLDSSFENIFEEYRLSYINEGARASSVPHFSKENYERLVAELFNNHKVTSVEVIKLPNKISVYDIEVENNENTHNFALEAGIFVHNSSASRMAWIAGTHIAEEMLMHDLQSVMIGGVHDSTYLDIYPGELIPVFKICQFHAGTVPNVIYDWMNGNKMFIDFGLGQSWGREMDIKSFEEKDGKFILNIKGGNCNWDYLKRELDEAYDYKILEMKEGDPIPPEEREELPIEVPTQLISLKLGFEDPCPNMEFKSKYFVGNGFYGKREE